LACALLLVAGLKREDFQILDNGSPRKIRLFPAESSTPSMGLSRVKALQMLRSRPAGDKIALYATGGKLQIELRLLFANPASGKIGTLIIPLSEVAAHRAK
jgi:hypothetical protein